jgi:hypothetical protein
MSKLGFRKPPKKHKKHRYIFLILVSHLQRRNSFIDIYRSFPIGQLLFQKSLQHLSAFGAGKNIIESHKIILL